MYFLSWAEHYTILYGWSEINNFLVSLLVSDVEQLGPSQMEYCPFVLAAAPDWCGSFLMIWICSTQPLALVLNAVMSFMNSFLLAIFGTGKPSFIGEAVWNLDGIDAQCYACTEILIEAIPWGRNYCFSCKISGEPFITTAPLLSLLDSANVHLNEGLMYLHTSCESGAMVAVSFCPASFGSNIYCG